jgi:hypothetical protein
LIKIFKLYDTAINYCLPCMKYNPCIDIIVRLVFWLEEDSTQQHVLGSNPEGLTMFLLFFLIFIILNTHL